jgi:hypothetical protein
MQDGARTEILFDDSGIVKIYHLYGGATEMRVGREERLLGQALAVCT